MGTPDENSGPRSALKVDRHKMIKIIFYWYDRHQ